MTPPQSVDDWMARTGYASYLRLRHCPAPLRPSASPSAYGLQDLRKKYRDPKTKSNPNTMCLPVTLGEETLEADISIRSIRRKTGHFYFALTVAPSFKPRI
jgi:hypothetical protein